MNNQTLLEKQQQERGKQIVDRFVRRFESSYRLLAFHAALPLVLTPELLNYLRNQFLRSDKVPWVAEVDLLLSDLCHPVGYEQYAMDNDVRAYLLEEMKQELGEQRMQDVARVLISYVHYLAKTNPFIRQQELQLQQWAAMVYLKEQQETVATEIVQAFQECVISNSIGISERQVNPTEIGRLAKITEEFASQLSAYGNLVEYAKVVSQLLVDPSTVEQQALRRSYQVLPDLELRLPSELIPDKEIEKTEAEQIDNTQTIGASSSEQQLERKRRILEEHYDLRAEKLKRLRSDYAIAADTLIRFQLEKQIEQTETELNELDQQLGDLERALSSGRVYRALLKLGYRDQTRAFRRFIETHSIAAFLIHGSLYYGQRWLLNRLVVQNVPNIMTGKVVRIELSRIRRIDNAALWRELGGKVGLGRQSSIPEIVERVYQWWQTQNVLLILYDVDCISEVFLLDIINFFWIPLTTKVKQASSQTSQFKLLMFLVDYDGIVDSWNIPFVERLDSTWNSDNTVKLPKIKEFSEHELTNWLEYAADELPTKLIEQLDETVQTILKSSDNGIPEPALGEICRLCGVNWYDEEEKWLRL